MKKAFNYSWILMIILCSFMGNINAEYQFINPENEYEVHSIKNDIYTLSEDYHSEYDSQKSSSSIGVYGGSLCPNGITLVDKDGNSTVHDFEEYVAGVVAAENSWHQGDNIENIKAQAVAARTYALKRTNYCQSSITNGQSAQVYRQTNDPYILRGIDETKGMILQYNGSILSTEYDAFCVINRTDSEYTIKQKNQVIPKSFIQTMGNAYVNIDYCYGHGRGMSQIGSRYLQSAGYTFDQILTYYYPVGIEIVRPMATSNWKQYDPAWSGLLLGASSGTNMGAIGCLVTSAAIVIAQSGVKTPLGDDFNPGTFAEYLKSHNGFTDGGSLKGGAVEGFVNVSIEGVIPDYSASTIQSYLQQGKQVIVKNANPSDPSDTHFVAVSGVEGDKVLISDPSGSCTVLSECNSSKVPVGILVYTFG